MPVNAVAPWEGELVWVGEPNSGKTQNGKEWMSVDFTLKYQDSQMNEKHITFNVFGADKVEKLLKMPEGTMLKVVWWPDANEARNGKWYPKLSAISIGLAQTQKQPATEKVAAPYFPPNPVQQQFGQQVPITGFDGTDDPSGDLPF